jgi:hypothetical protein
MFFSGIINYYRIHKNDIYDLLSNNGLFILNSSIKKV